MKLRGHNDFGIFLNRASKTPLLTGDQEIELGRLIREWLDNPDPSPLVIRRGQKAKSHLIQANIRLVVDVAKRHQNRGVEIPDLVQEGCLGLNRAAELFDPTKGYRFSTYAYNWISQAIVRGIEGTRSPVRLPNHIHALLGQAQKEVAIFSRAHGGKKPTVRQLTEALVAKGRLTKPVYHPKGTDPMDLAADKLCHAVTLSRAFLSLNAPLPGSDEDDLEAIGALRCTKPRPEDVAIVQAQAELVNRAMAILTPEEREIITAYFGLDGWPPRSLVEIAQSQKEDFNEARMRVRRLHNSAIRRIRRWIDGSAIDLLQEA